MKNKSIIIIIISFFGSDCFILENVDFHNRNNFEYQQLNIIDQYSEIDTMYPGPEWMEEKASNDRQVIIFADIFLAVVLIVAAFTLGFLE